MEASGRQPALGEIRTSMIIAAALVEGVLLCLVLLSVFCLQQRAKDSIRKLENLYSRINIIKLNADEST